MGFVHLHCHSEFSALDGLSTVPEMLKAAAADDQPAIAVTDHGNCAAHPQLQVEADKVGLKPIFGLEAYFVDDRFSREGKATDYWHLIMWAMDDQGLRNLWAMSTESYQGEALWGKYPRLDWDVLQRLNEGVMCSTACLGGPVANPFIHGDEERAVSNLLRLQEIFGDRLYAEIQTTHEPDQMKVNRWWIETTERYGIQPVVSCDSHYPTAGDKHDHSVWMAAATNRDIGDDSAMFAGGHDYHIMTEAEVREALSYLPDDFVERGIANTLVIADRCSAKIQVTSRNPVFSRKTTEHPDPAAHDIQRLLDKCLARWDERTRGKEHSQSEYMDRFENEFMLVTEKGFSGYFLIVADIVTAAKKHGILVGPGRGSGAGSLVAYLLGITEIDPVKYDVLFERFMTKGRTELPDFDLDFPSSTKQWVYNYAAQRWGGEDHVCTVGTHMRLRSKSSFKDIAKAIASQLPEDYFPDVQAIVDVVEAAEGDTAGLGLPWDQLWDRIEEPLTELGLTEKYPELFRLAAHFHGRLKTYGKHPAGIIIDPDNPLTESLPLRQGEDGQMIAQFDLKVLELLGYVKIDLLNISNLDMIQQTIDLVERTTGKRINPYAWADELEDPYLYEQIGEGHCLGLFQIGSNIGISMSRRMKPQNLRELADSITIVRPGPDRSGLKDLYLARRAGEDEVSYPDPRMAAVLGNTWGCFATETRVVTKQGVREIGDLAGANHDLMTTGGVWANAEIRSFGTQPLMKVTLQRNKQEKIIYATPNHRWFGRWSDSKSKVKELLTTELQPHMVLAAQMPRQVASQSTSSPFGIAAGIVFGDGTRTENQASVRLYGEKDAQLLKYFPNSRTRSYTPSGGPDAMPYIEVIDLPRSWRDRPSLDEGTSYLKGWLAGYFAADGQVTAKGSPLISSAKKEDLEYFRTVAHLVGIGTYTIARKVVQSALPGVARSREVVCYDMGLVASTVDATFFLIEEHRRRFNAAHAIRQKVDRVQWAVVAVEETDRMEEVFCAVVPETHAFVLEDNILTGNCMIYQEQLMKLCMVIAAMDDVEADKVRKILGKKKVEEAKKLGAAFIERALATGTDEMVTRELWAQMEEFAKYSFGYAHALSYAILGVWTAWFKFHYPLQFLCAALSIVDSKKIPAFIEEARRMGYKVLPPDINSSGRGFSLGDSGMDIRYGLDAIKGVGEAALAPILANQPFTSFEDFRERAVGVNSGVLKTLVRIGAFDSLEPNRRWLEKLLEFEDVPAAQQCQHRVGEDQPIVWLPSPVKGAEVEPQLVDWMLPCGYDWQSEPDEINDKTGRKIKRKAPAKKCTKSCRHWSPVEPPAREDVSPYDDRQIRIIEKEMMGIYLSSTPFDVIPEEDLARLATAEDILSGPEGKTYMAAAIIQGFRHAKKRQDMGFLSLSTPRGSFSTVVFPAMYALHGEEFRVGRLVYVAVSKNDRGQALEVFEPTSIE